MNAVDHQKNSVAELLALLSGSQISEQPEATDADAHDASTAKTKHSLNEQVKQAGFFGYQQNKSQLLADLTSVFGKDRFKS